MQKMILAFALTVASVAAADPSTRLERQIRHELVMLPYYGVFDRLVYSVNGGTVILGASSNYTAYLPTGQTNLGSPVGLGNVVLNDGAVQVNGSEAEAVSHHGLAAVGGVHEQASSSVGCLAPSMRSDACTPR